MINSLNVPSANDRPTSPSYVFVCMCAWAENDMTGLKKYDRARDREISTEKSPHNSQTTTTCISRGFGSRRRLFYSFFFFGSLSDIFNTQTGTLKYTRAENLLKQNKKNLPAENPSSSTTTTTCFAFFFSFLHRGFSNKTFLHNRRRRRWWWWWCDNEAM